MRFQLRLNKHDNMNGKHGIMKVKYNIMNVKPDILIVKHHPHLKPYDER